MTAWCWILLLLSLLTVVKAPVLPLWYVAIAVTEWGHWLGILSIGVGCAAAKSPRAGAIARRMAFLAALLFFTPLVRALFTARHLPKQFTTVTQATSGPADTLEKARRKPIDPIQLFTTLPRHRVNETTVFYSNGASAPLAMDLYTPLEKVARPMPGIVVVHGGSWKSGHRKGFRDFNQYLASRGYLVAAIDYRLAPQAQFPAQREDVLKAMDYLKSQAASFNLDPKKLVIVGRSAGGQLALSAAYAKPDPAIRGVIALYAPIDLIWGYRNPSPRLIMDSKKVLRDYIGGTPDSVPIVYQAASPLLHVNETTPPTLLIHGGRDELVSPRHAEFLLHHLASARRPYYYVAMPWATHGCDVVFSGPCGQMTLYSIERFLYGIFA